VIKTLVSIDVDLTSSLAIRFACQLGNSIQMEIQPVYVKGIPPHESSIGAGWARRTWEREVVLKGKEEITEMITSEMDFCPLLREPKVIFGDREAELLKLIEREFFHLYVEGVHFPWSTTATYKSLHSRFYQRLGRPFVLVRSLRKIQKILILCLDPEMTSIIIETFKRIWSGCDIPLCFAFPDSGKSLEAEKGLEREVAKAREALTGSGCRVAEEIRFPSKLGGPSEAILKDFGLIHVPIPKGVKKDSALMKWLQHVSIPLMVVLH
jgi:hypothetical protein